MKLNRCRQALLQAVYIYTTRSGTWGTRGNWGQ